MSIQELNQQVDTMSKQLKLAKTVAEVDAISTRYSDFICNTRESAYKDASQKQKNDFTTKNCRQKFGTWLAISIILPLLSC